MGCLRKRGRGRVGVGVCVKKVNARDVGRRWQFLCV